MNAKEAAKSSDRAARLKAIQEATKRIKNREARVRQLAAARAKFLKEFSDRCDNRIRVAVQDGEKSCRIQIGKEQHAPVPAQEEFDKHEFLPNIKKVMSRLRRDGFAVTQSTDDREHQEYSDISGFGDTYWRSYAYIEISWGKK